MSAIFFGAATNTRKVMLKHPSFKEVVVGRTALHALVLGGGSPSSFVESP